MNIVSVLLLLIGAGFIVGCVLWARSFKLIQRERAAAQALLKRRELTLASNTIMAALGKDGTTLGGQLLRDMLWQGGMAFARLSDVLEPILDRVQRLNAAARAIPNLLLLLGLIATVAGLIDTLSNLGPDIQGAITAGNPKEVANQLGRTITSMGSAFLGTLCGVLTTLILQFLNIFSAVHAGKLAGELDELGAQFAPQVYPASSEKQLESLQALVIRSEEFLSTTQQKIAETSETFAAVLGEAGRAIETSLKTLESTSSQVSGALLQASGDVKRSSDQLTNAAESIQRHREDFRNIYTSFNDMFNRSMEALKSHSDGELKEIRQLQGDFGKTGAAIVGEIFKTSEKIGALSDGLATNQHTYLTGVQKVETALVSGFERLDSQVGATFRRYTDEVQTVSLKLEGMTQQMGQGQDATLRLERTLRAKDDAERTRMNDQQQRDQATATQITALTASLGQLERVIAAYQQQPEQLAQQAAEQTQLITQVLGASQQLYDRLVSALQDVTGTLGAQHALSGQMRDQLREMGFVLTGLLDQTSALGNRLVDGSQQGAQLDAVAQHTLSVKDAVERLPAQLQVEELLRGSRDLQRTMTRMLGSLEGAPLPPAQGRPA